MARRSAVLLLVLATLGLGVTATAAAAPATVQNPSLEQTTGTVPTCFTQAGWGTGTATWTLTSAARTGAVAQSLRVTGYANGDRKLLPTESAACAPAVTPGQTYTLSVASTSTTSAIALTVFRHSAAGWTYWTDLKSLPASSGWAVASGVTPAVPAGTDQLSFGISLAGNGTLVTDDYALTPTTPTQPPPPPTAELSVNTGLEEGGATPSSWFLAGWGDATVTAGATTTNPHGGSRAYALTLAGRTQGDYKLLPSEAASPKVQPGQSYRLSLWYRSTSAANSITVFTHTAAGWQYLADLMSLPASSTWVKATVDTPAIPAGVDAIAWGVSLSANGTLVTDDYSTTLLGAAPPPGGGTPTTPTPPGGTPTTPTTPTPPAPPASTPETQGRGSVLNYQMPIRAMHATVLKNGKVLLLAGSGNDLSKFAAGTFQASVWTPVAGTFTTIAVPKDMFCAGHVTLPDGKVLIQGGTRSYPTTTGGADYGGLKDSWIFDPDTNRFTTADDANEGHWYPTLTELGNGDVWMGGGLKEDTTGAVNTEMWSTSAKSWLPGAQVPQTYSFWGVPAHVPHGRRPPVLQRRARLRQRPAGHRRVDLQLAERLDHGRARPAQQGPARPVGVRAAAARAGPARPHHRRRQHRHQHPGHPPDRHHRPEGRQPRLPARPGSSGRRQDVPQRLDPARPDGARHERRTVQPGRRLQRVHRASYDPATNAWSSVAADPIGRNYHSTAVLLPDGRVAVLGSRVTAATSCGSRSTSRPTSSAAAVRRSPGCPRSNGDGWACGGGDRGVPRALGSVAGAHVHTPGMDMSGMDMSGG